MGLKYRFAQISLGRLAMNKEANQAQGEGRKRPLHSRTAVPLTAPH